MGMAVTVGVIWMVCGVLALGLTMGDLKRTFPGRSYEWLRMDKFLAIMAIAGPFGLIAALTCSSRPYQFTLRKW